MIVNPSQMFQFMGLNYKFFEWASIRHLLFTLNSDPPWVLRNRSKEYLVVRTIRLLDHGDLIDLVVTAQFTRFDAAFAAYKLLGGKGV